MPCHLPYQRYCPLQGNMLVHSVLNQQLVVFFSWGCELGLEPIRANCYYAPQKQKCCLSVLGLLNQASRDCLIRRHTQVPILLSLASPIFFFFLLGVNFCLLHCFSFLEIDVFTGIKKVEIKKIRYTNYI